VGSACWSLRNDVVELSGDFPREFIMFINTSPRRSSARTSNLELGGTGAGPGNFLPPRSGNSAETS
jgi:hypothetical protein